MKFNILILSITILLGAGLTFWLDRIVPATPATTLNITDNVVYEKFPDFVFTDLNGQKYETKNFHGKIIVLNFWATWCAPCVIEFPKLVQLAKNNRDIVVIALSSDIDDEKIQHFLKKTPIAPQNFIVARDLKRQITSDLFKTYKLPETLIISRSGEIVKKIVGDTDWLGKDMQDIFSSLDK